MISSVFSPKPCCLQERARQVGTRPIPSRRLDERVRGLPLKPKPLASMGAALGSNQTSGRHKWSHFSAVPQRPIRDFDFERVKRHRTSLQFGIQVGSHSELEAKSNLRSLMSDNERSEIISPFLENLYQRRHYDGCEPIFPESSTFW